MIETALSYSSRGWAVLPVHNSTNGVCSCTKRKCPAVGKHPRTNHGLKDATNNPDLITQWWKSWPSANIGIATGKKSGIVVIDIDPRHGGNETLLELIENNGPLPDTLKVITGGGGQHLYFKYPGHPLRSRSNIWPGIDVRADGGFVVAPPSVHVSGMKYVWEDQADPSGMPLADLPEWILLQLRPLKREMRIDSGEQFKRAPSKLHNSTAIVDELLRQALQRCVPGSRNNDGFWLACQLRDNGISETEALAVGYPERVPPGDHPYSRDEWEITVRSAFKEPPREPSGIISVGQSEPCTPPPQENDPEPQPPNLKRKTSWTVADLYDAEIPEPAWIIPDIWPVGLTFLGGRPKIGKSWLLLQIAHAVSVGGMIFDQRVEQGEVLYLAFEDNPKRLQSRCKSMRIPKTSPIQFALTWKPFHKGGLDDLLVEIERHKYRYIVIDTLTRAIPGVDQNDPKIIGPIISQLQCLALGHNLSITLADHTRKPNGMSADPIDDIIGSTAKSASADAVLALYKEQGKVGIHLRGRGKDIEEIDLMLAFDKLTGSWQCQGNASEIAMTESRNEIIEYLKEAGKSQLPRIHKALGGDRGNLYRKIQDLVNAGRIRKERIEGRAYYELIQQ